MGVYDQAAVRALGPNGVEAQAVLRRRERIEPMTPPAKARGKFGDRGPATHLTMSLKPNALLRHWKLEHHTVAFGLAPIR